MKWVKHKAISEADLELLAGTDIMVEMQKNRIVVIYKNNEDPVSDVELGMKDFKEIFAKRPLHEESNFKNYFENDENVQRVYEYLFSSKEDMALFEEKLTLARLKYSHEKVDDKE